jgi:hypothetical protein
VERGVARAERRLVGAAPRPPIQLAVRGNTHDAREGALGEPPDIDAAGGCGGCGHVGC